MKPPAAKLHVTDDLLAKYDRPGPRYTSYPTAPAWTDSFGAADYQQRLEAAGKRDDQPLSMYVHLPFCERLCWFCGCNKIITQDHGKARRYVDDVLAEARTTRQFLGASQPVVQHHWGGGTPTFLSPDECQRLLRGLVALFPLTDDAEVSIEVDPRVTTHGHLEALTAVGFNRISMGVQDFDPAVQQAIHREQSLLQTRDLITTARQLGFESVNVDLIYGLPHQTPRSFCRSIDAVIDLAPDRIACYGFAYVPWLSKQQKILDESLLPRGKAKLELYLQALDRLQDAGYLALGMDHFARNSDELADASTSGKLHRNFQGYTTRPATDMVSFGVSAISDVDGAFAQNQKELAAWREQVTAGRLPVQRGLRRSEQDERRRSIILDLMCRFALRFDDHGGADAFRAEYAEQLDQLVPMADDGLLEFDDGGLTITELGKLFVRNLAMVFDSYLAQPNAKFSRTV